MKLNKIMIMATMLVLSVNLYAKNVKLDTVKIDYINFDSISLNNLFNFLSKEYKVNFSIEPARKEHIVSVRMQHSNMKELLDSILIQNSMTYKIKNNIIYITSNKHYLEKRFTRGKYTKSRITLKYASVSDAISFLQDMMPGRTVIRTSTENKLYSNLYNADPDLEPPEHENTQRQEGGGDLGFRVFQNDQGMTGGNSRRSTSRGKRGSRGGYSGNTNNTLYNKIIPDDVLFIVPFYNENKVYFLSTSYRIIAEAKRLIKEIDKPSKQVLIQGQIMEFTISDGFKSIFDFQYRDAALVPGSANPTSSVGFGNLKYAFLDSQLVANIDVAKNEGRATFVASPTLLTMNRVSATFDITEDVSIITGVEKGSVTTYDSGTVVVPPIPIYETKKLGTQIAITPFINSGNEILLKIELDISSKSGNTQTIVVPTATGGAEEFTFDSISESSIDTMLTTANKKTIVFGGIIRDTMSKEETKVSILGDIPLLGIPFRNTRESAMKKELVIILTATIVDSKNPNAVKNINEGRKRFGKYKGVSKRFGNKAARGGASPRTIKRNKKYNKEIEEFLKQ